MSNSEHGRISAEARRAARTSVPSSTLAALRRFVASEVYREHRVGLTREEDPGQAKESGRDDAEQAHLDR